MGWKDCQGGLTWCEGWNGNGGRVRGEGSEKESKRKYVDFVARVVFGLLQWRQPVSNRDLEYCSAKALAVNSVHIVQSCERHRKHAVWKGSAACLSALRCL